MAELDPHIAWRIARRKGGVRETLRETRVELSDDAMARIARLEAAVMALAEHAERHIHTGPNKEPMAFVETNASGEVVRLVADSRKPLEAA